MAQGQDQTAHHKYHCTLEIPAWLATSQDLQDLQDNLGRLVSKEQQVLPVLLVLKAHREVLDQLGYAELLVQPEVA